jgi:hypothetical protein
MQERRKAYRRVSKKTGQVRVLCVSWSHSRQPGPVRQGYILCIPKPLETVKRGATVLI